METNLSSIDQVVRVVAAEIFVALVLTNLVTGTFAIVLLVLSALLLISGVRGFCYVYKTIGVSTCEDEEASKHLKTAWWKG